MHVCCFTFCVHYPFCSAVKTDWKHLVHSSSSSVKSRASNCPLDGIAAAGLVCQRPWRLNSWATCSAIISPSFLLLGHSSFYLPLFNLAPPPHPPPGTPVLDVCVRARGFVSLSTIRQSETFHSDLKKRWWKPGWRGWHSFKSELRWQTLPPLGCSADDVAR